MSIASRIRRAKKFRVGGTGSKRCRKGKSCGATCISGGKVCLISLPDYAIRALSHASKRLGKIKKLGEAKKKAEKITMELKVQAPSAPTGPKEGDWLNAPPSRPS